MLDERYFLPIENEAKRVAFFKEKVRKVILETSSFCNRKCHFCPSALRTEKRLMDNALFDSVIRQLETASYEGQIILHLYNEPLAYVDSLLERIRRVRRALPANYIYFSTNGDYLTHELMDALADAGLSAMTISIHPGRAFNNEKLLNRFFSLGLRLGLDLRFTSFESGVSISCQTSFQNVDIKIRATDFMQRGSNRGELMTELKAPTDRTDPCALPFEILNIAYDGTLFPCYHFVAGIRQHAEYSLCKLTPDTSIFEAFNHPALRKWRRHAFQDVPKGAPCRSCRLDFYKISPEEQTRRALFLARLDGETI